jgi:hypothetical protein
MTEIFEKPVYYRLMWSVQRIIRQSILKFFLVCFSLFASVMLMRYIAVTFFFDRFYFQKSVEYGYWPAVQQLSANDFGQRGKDIADLEKFLREQSFCKIPTENDDVFTIVIFGDSYVWGQGVKNSQRFPLLLEKKLNTILPTKVISFGKSGDNFVDNYLKYRYAQEMYADVDLFLFGMVSNDLLLSNDDKYHLVDAQQILNQCDGKAIYDWVPKLDELNDPDIRSNPSNVFRIDSTFKSNTKNFCLFLHVLQLVPKERALYLNFDGFRFRWHVIEEFRQGLEMNGLTVFSFENFYQKKYTKYPIDPKTSGKDQYSVSAADNHPSALANKMYAEALFEEITQNPRWRFGSN